MEEKNVRIQKFLFEVLQTNRDSCGIPISKVESLLASKFDHQFSPQKYGFKKTRELIINCLPSGVEFRDDFLIKKKSEPKKENILFTIVHPNGKQEGVLQPLTNIKNRISNELDSSSSSSSKAPFEGKENYESSPNPKAISIIAPQYTAESNVPGFIHQDERFKNFIERCSEDTGIDPFIIEKDYYLSHAIWCLRKRGLEIEIKGGVSLSKGFRILDRLSEDVDIAILPIVQNPNSVSSKYDKELHNLVNDINQMDLKSKQKVYERSLLWKKFATILRKKNTFPGMTISMAGKNSPFYEPRWIHLVLYASYTSLFKSRDDDLMPPCIVLEFCTTKEVPLEPISLRLNSILQNFLEEKRMLYQFKRNTPTVFCTHPMITLIQKISDGVINRYQRPIESQSMPPYASGLRGQVPPFDPRIIRHYEDAAAIILNIDKCYPLATKLNYESLYKELMTRRMVRRKLEEGTSISNHESLKLEDELRKKLLRLCQQQRFCLYYQSVKKNTVNPPPLEECAMIINKWLEEIGF